MSIREMPGFISPQNLETIDLPIDSLSQKEQSPSKIVELETAHP
jgi:hypothetical protein